jgi:hypothetical protein
LYKSCGIQSGLKGAEVVAEITPLPGGEIDVHEMGVMTEETIANPIAVEKLTQEEWQDVTHRVNLGSELAKTNYEALNLAVDDEMAISESDEENVQPSVDTAPDAPVSTVDEGNPRVREEVRKMSQLFESLEAVKFFFQDYVVRHHRPYYVVKSNKDIWYVMGC